MSYRSTRHQLRRGTTLLELIIAAVILSIASVALAQMIIQSLRVYDTGLNQSVLEQETDLFSERLERQMREARLLSFGTSFLEFQEPLDHDDDGDIVDDNGVLELGAGGILGYRTLYNVVVVDTFVEAERGYDLNQDGDTADSLGLATIEENTITDDIPGVNVATSVLLTNVVTSLPTIGGDIDGDGIADPIFIRTNFLGEIDPDGRTLQIKLVRVRISGNTTVRYTLETAVTSRQF